MMATIEEEFWGAEKPVIVGFAEENGTTYLLINEKRVCSIDTDCMEDFLTEVGRIICHWKETEESK